MEKLKKTNHWTSLSPNLQLAIEAAWRGGTIISGDFATAGEALEKANGKGLVTQTDQAAERVIIDTLQANSSYAIMSEETAPDKPLHELSWIVDPLDGTTNFASKIPLFAVSVALLQDQEVMLGVIFNPMTEECFYAEKGKGTYLNGQPVHVSSKADPASTILFLNHGYRAADRKRYAIVADRFSTDYFVRTFGPTALELSSLAHGCAAGFICCGDELWDYAAGIVLIEEAGGRVTDWKGRHWSRSNSFILASNGSCHEELIEKIADLQP